MAERNPPKPGGSGSALPPVEKLVKYMADVNAALASLQSDVDSMKTGIIKQLADSNTLRAEEHRIMTARVATLGNQMSYFRETVCEGMKANVRKYLKEIKRDLIN